MVNMPAGDPKRTGGGRGTEGADGFAVVKAKVSLGTSVDVLWTPEKITVDVLRWRRLVVRPEPDDGGGQKTQQQLEYLHHGDPAAQ